VTSTDSDSPGSEDLLLRPAEPAEADALADLHTAARAAAYPSMPASVHTADETRAWMRGRVGTTHEVWVAERSGSLLGYAAMARPEASGGAWLDDLYVAPGHTGQGTGSTLLELAMSLRPRGFALWVFASNEGARRFYRHHGLVELEHTDGSGNEERAPDVRMAWPGRDPLAYLRSELDAVDGELAVLLGRRAALTAVVQRYKTVPGHAGRDPEREAEIVARMAAHVPGVPEVFWRRVVHEVISASLDVAEGR
jgi:chorismate mutase/GNAT superfamily N-acetyltransferase